MQGRIDKNIIKQRFKKSLKSYRDNASVQNRMAKILIEELLKTCGNTFPRMFEIGSGAGVLTEEILNNLSVKEFFVNDIVEEACHYSQNNLLKTQFICGDAEIINFPKNLDLIISNATFQWLENLPAFFKKTSDSLNTNGIIAFTTFGSENYKEIAALTGLSLEYNSLDELEVFYGKYFKKLYQNTSIAELFFKTPEDLLRHIKNTGTNSLVSKKMAIRDLKFFKEEYKQKFANEKGVKLTYNPCYLILKKLK